MNRYLKMITAFALICVMLFVCVGCGKQEAPAEPEIEQMDTAESGGQEAHVILPDEPEEPAATEEPEPEEPAETEEPHSIIVNPMIGKFVAKTAVIEGVSGTIAEQGLDPMEITLRDDGTGFLEYEGEKYEFTWKMEASRFHADMADNIVMDGVYADKQLVFDNMLQSNIAMVFEKVN